MGAEQRENVARLRKQEDADHHVHVPRSPAHDGRVSL